jgi:hypothetical protein
MGEADRFHQSETLCTISNRNPSLSFFYEIV